VEWRKLKNVEYPTDEGDVEWEKQLLEGGFSFEVSSGSLR